MVDPAPPPRVNTRRNYILLTHHSLLQHSGKPREVVNGRAGEDSTVNRLQQLAAELTGKEAALFTPTGTMGAPQILTHAIMLKWRQQ